MTTIQVNGPIQFSVLPLQTIIPGTSGLDVLDTIRVLTDARYIALACLTWLIYDYFANLRREVSLIWKAGWSTTKVLYVLNRFLAPIMSGTQCFILFNNNELDNVHCSALARFISLTHFAMSTVQGAAMSIRVWYIWTHRRLIQWLIGIGFVLSLLLARYLWC